MFMKKLIFLALPMLCMALAFSFKSNFKVSGWIKDEQGSAIAFATVKEKGTSTAVAADQHGYFSFEVSSGNTTLEFSAVGFVSKTVKVENRSVLSVVIATVQNQLENAMIGAPSSVHINGQDKANKRIGYATSPQGMYQDDVGFNTEGYDYIKDNGFHTALDNPLSTFSIDVDAASYSNVRRFLSNGQLPPAGAVRVEEMINYFPYNYQEPKNDLPFSFHTEMGTAPWNSEHKLIMIGMQGKKIPVENLPASNLVFLIDVSGSMMSADKLDLVKSSMKLLVDQLREKDRVSIVVYAGAAGLVLSPTSGANKTTISNAIDRLQAGGSTAGGEGIKLAYKTAREHFMGQGNNRVILCTDGDFNVGMSSDDDMERLIEQERKSGVFLTVLGYGMGNYKDNKMQKLADKGNGNHAYIDGMQEAKKLLVNEFGGTLFTIAKDVKLQVEFNPAHVQAYRLVGYENRLLNKEDFNDDKKDAGELGSGHTVTAIYEIIPVGVKSSFVKSIDPLKYNPGNIKGTTLSNEVMTIKFRYKDPSDSTSKLLVHVVKKSETGNSVYNSQNFRFASAVAQFGMLLRDSEFKGISNYNSVLKIAQSAIGNDKGGYMYEFINLVKTAMQLAKSGVKKNDEDMVSSHQN
jgi:Ca-activated chloride channel family protein